MLSRLSIALMLAAASTAVGAHAVTPAPQRFLIERDIPGGRELGPDIQWVHSYVAGDKAYCVYQAVSEALIRGRAAKCGFPASRITPITTMLDPTTASRGC